MSPLPPSISTSILYPYILSIVNPKILNLKIQNRSIESQYVLDVLVMELVIVAPSGACLIV